MSNTKPYEFDDEPDGIEEGENNLPSGSTNPHQIDEVNSSNGSQVANNPNFAVNNDAQINREDELKFAGIDEEADELLASEYRIKQENEQAEIRPVSEKPTVRMFSVLTGTGVVIGIFGFLWFTFFAPKPVSQQAKTSTPEVTPSPPNDESGELKSRLAFQDQQRTLEAEPPTPKERLTPTPTPSPTPAPTSKPTPKPVPVARQPEPPRRVQNFNPPPRIVRTISPPPTPSPPPRPTPSPPPRLIQSPSPPPRPTPLPPRLVQLPPPTPPPPPRPVQSPPPPPAEKVDPYERWAQLASLGQSRGEVTDSPTTESAVASNPIASPSTTIAAPGTIPAPSPVAIATPTPSTGTLSISPTATPTPSIGTLAITPTPTLSPGTPTTTPVATSTPLTPPNSQNRQPMQINPQNTRPSPTPGVEPGIPAIATNSPQLATSNPSSISEGEAGILTRTPVNQNSDDGIATRQIAIGSFAKARVIVPMIWDEAGISPTAGRFAVELTEDMKATDGAIALPSGTILITQVDNVTRPNRLVSQSVVAIVYPDSTGRIHQVAIPPGNLLIRGEDNQPLIAEGLFDKGSEIAKTDILVGVLSSLGRVGEVINRPTEETFSQQSGPFGSTTVQTTNRSRPNILAAALEGFSLSRNN